MIPMGCRNQMTPLKLSLSTGVHFSNAVGAFNKGFQLMVTSNIGYFHMNVCFVPLLDVCIFLRNSTDKFFL
jgi:hypothetical protein